MTLLERGSRSRDAVAGRAKKAEEKRRRIEVRIISAQDLKRARLQVGRTRAYAVVYVDGDGADDRRRARTGVDERGGENPVWNDVVTVTVREAQLRKDSLACLTVDIYSQGGGRLSLFRRRDRLVGSVRIFLSDVVKLGGGAAFHNPIQCLAFWVRLPSGEPHGILNVWIPPSGEFLRRHHDSQEFSRILAFPPPPAAATSVRLPAAAACCSPPSPAGGAASLAGLGAHHHDPSIDTEAFTFDV